MTVASILEMLTPLQWFFFAFCGFLIGMNKGGVPAISMVTIPIFATLFGGKASTGIMLPILLVADSIAVRHYFKDVEWRKLATILPASIVGVLIALAVGNRINDTQFKHIIAITILICLVPMIWQQKKGKQSEIELSPTFSICMGIAGGFASMIGNAAGPILSIYLLALCLPKNRFIATRAIFFFSINIVKLPLQICIWKTINVQSLLMDAIIFPIVIAGTVMGIWTVKHVEEKLYRNIVLVATFLSAVLLFF